MLLIILRPLTDLSLVGCSVKTTSICPVGTALEIVLQARDVRVHAHGRVAVGDTIKGMGIEFTRTLDTTLKRLPKSVKMIRSK
jgi:hypothetical protein